MAVSAPFLCACERCFGSIQIAFPGQIRCALHIRCKLFSDLLEGLQIFKMFVRLCLFQIRCCRKKVSGFLRNRGNIPLPKAAFSLAWDFAYSGMIVCNLAIFASACRFPCDSPSWAKETTADSKRRQPISAETLSFPSSIPPRFFYLVPSLQAGSHSHSDRCAGLLIANKKFNHESITHTMSVVGAATFFYKKRAIPYSGIAHVSNGT